MSFSAPPGVLMPAFKCIWNAIVFCVAGAAGGLNLAFIFCWIVSRCEWSLGVQDAMNWGFLSEYPVANDGLVHQRRIVVLRRLDYPRK